LEIPEGVHQQAIELKKILGDRSIWIAASTHEGEEDIILAAHQKVLANTPDALLILVPRHPDRFEQVETLCRKSFTTVLRSSQQVCDKQTQVYLGDTMGDLMLLYTVADIAFVGGSLIPSGGHNILEPAALAKPVITGPHDFNFAEIGKLFYLQNAIVKVTDADSLANAVITFITNRDERLAMGERALQVMSANRGALAKQLALIDQVICRSR